MYAARGYVVIAISSADRKGSKCWDTSSPDSEDGKKIAKILNDFLANEGLSDKPLYALGASSGGAFVLGVLPKLIALNGIVAQIMAVPPDKLG